MICTLTSMVAAAISLLLLLLLALRVEASEPLPRLPEPEWLAPSES